MFRLIHIMVLPKFYNVANPFIYPSGICSSKCWKLDESDTQSNGQWAIVDRQNNQWNMYTTRPEQLAYLHIQAHKYTSHKKSYTWKQTDPVSGQKKNIELVREKKEDSEKENSQGRRKNMCRVLCVCGKEGVRPCISVCYRVSLCCFSSTHLSVRACRRGVEQCG